MVVVATEVAAKVAAKVAVAMAAVMAEVAMGAVMVVEEMEVVVMVGEVKAVAMVAAAMVVVAVAAAAAFAALPRKSASLRRLCIFSRGQVHSLSTRSWYAQRDTSIPGMYLASSLLDDFLMRIIADCNARSSSRHSRIKLVSTCS